MKTHFPKQKKDPVHPTGVGAKVLFISLGCAKNQVDSEIMIRLLEEAGFFLTDRQEEALAVVINTCSFIETAVRESIEAILDAARLKEAGTCRALVVTGCFPQRYQRSLIEELPEVDLFLGTESFSALPERLKDLLAGKRPAKKMILKTDRDLWQRVRPRHLFGSPGTAYLKIAEGCSNRCSYCTIPSIRGPLRSRPPEVLLAEARLLVEQGVKELVLVAQEVTAYGMDREGPVHLAELLRRLLAEAAPEWIRLLYLRPERITRELLQIMADSDRICPYFDLPLQHINDRILKAMNRPYGKKEAERIIQEIRRLLPQAALRTTMMVGFPGEREEDFQELLDFVGETAFDHLGAFLYSPEEGTPAAAFPEQIPKEIGQRRLAILMERQRQISAQKNKARIGKVEEVLISGPSPESELLLQGRTRFQAPDVDGVVYITDGRPRIGEIVRVKITQAHDYDLAGVALE